MRHIGILGGTFNPIHLGHLILGESAREQLGLAQVLFIPTALPPHKDEPDLLPAGARVALVQAAIASNPAFAMSDLEIRRGGRSYTIDTLRALRDQQGPETAWTVLVVVFAWRFSKIAFAVYLPVAAGLVAACLYFGYHYLIDIPAGVLAALASWYAARWINRWWYRNVRDLTV